VLDPELAARLGTIQSAPLVVLGLGYDEAEIVAARGPLDGFGFLIPRSEGLRSLGVLWDSSIYPGRASSGQVLLRVMMGGATDPAVVELPDEDLLLLARRELRRTMGFDLQPGFVRIFRHRTGIPQYTLGHLDRLSQIDARLRLHPGMYVAGSSYRGVGINNCIVEAQTLSTRILSALATASGVEGAAA
jgi:oxygen-dependent protoporphyrinogen oxidase